MRYTINGAPPTSTIGTLISASSGTVTVTPSPLGATLRVIAYKAGMIDSEVHEAVFYYENESGNMPNPGDGGPGGGGILIDGGQPTISYDANGNLIHYKEWNYRYDAQNRLIEAWNGTTIARFYYDGKNRQIARNINGVVRFNSWDGWELLEEYSSSLNVVTAYLQGATGVIKSWSAANTLYYYQDKLGSTTHVANGGGQLLESYKYDLYGTPSYFSSTSQPLNQSAYNVADLYAGERWIPELRLYDLRNRFMSPELGRFLQTDPIGFKGDASNLYRYCGNDPVDGSDPMGLTDVNYVGNGTFFDSMVRHYNDGINPGEVISVSAHGSPTGLFNTWNDTGKRVPLPVQQVVTDIQTRASAKFSNKDMQIRLYSCRAGDWRAAALQRKLCPAQELANASHRKVQATGANINPTNGSKSISETCNDLNWYEFSPDAKEPTRIVDPTGYRVVGHNPGPTEGAAMRSQKAFDSFGSTTQAAAEWEKSWGNGGWLAGHRLGR